MRTIKLVILITLLASVVRNSFSQTSVVVVPNITKGNQNVAVGLNAGNVMSGSNGVFIGAYSGQSTTSGADNVMFGWSAGQYNTLGARNVFAGSSAGLYNSIGVDNIFFGYESGRENTVGSKNIFIGGYAGFGNISGNQSVAVGYQAGYLTTGSDNLFLGYQAGYNEAGSNKLYIANTSTSTPLVYGEFENNMLVVNSNLGIGADPEYELDVCGTIRAWEMKIDLNGTCVPDFVFKEDYPLMDLSELEKFVQTKHHLPEIPSEKEMHENGMNMMELQLKLLQKIEELTLYKIAQDNMIKKLEEKVEFQGDLLEKILK